MTLAWSKIELEMLTKFFHEGKTAGQIAEKFGVSRSTICGKLDRMGLKRGKAFKEQTSKITGQVQGKVIQQKLRAQKNSVIEAKKQFSFISKPEEKVEPYTPAGSAFTALPGSAPISILELTSTTCRWPIDIPGEAINYCGKSADGRYCKRHTKLAERPAPPIDKRLAYFK